MLAILSLPPNVLIGAVTSWCMARHVFWHHVITLFHVLHMFIRWLIMGCGMFLKRTPPCAAYMRQWIRSALVQINSHYLNQCWNSVNWTIGKKNFSEILIEINKFPFKKMRLKMASVEWRLFHLGFNELTANFQLSVQNSRLRSRCEITLRWMPQNLTKDKSTFVQLMVWYIM